MDKEAFLCLLAPILKCIFGDFFVLQLGMKWNKKESEPVGVVENHLDRLFLFANKSTVM